MPYIVTTKSAERECVSCEQTKTGAPGAGGADWLCGDCGGWDGASRRAVATLDAAKQHAILCAPTALHNEAREPIIALPEQGGTVTLPDGTVIEVKQVSWLAICNGMPEADWIAVEGHPQAEVIAAYNAAQN